MHALFVTLAKIIGLLQFFGSLQYLAFAIPIIQGGTVGGGSNFQIVVSGSIGLAVSLLLLIKAEWLAGILRIDEREISGLTRADLMSTGIVLVGLYLFITSAPTLLSAIYRLFIEDLGPAITYVNQGPWMSVLKSILAVVLILWPAKIVALAGAGDRRSGMSAPE